VDRLNRQKNHRGEQIAKEDAVFESEGALSASLGPYVLRTETAALAALAIFQDHLLRVRKK